MRPATVFLSSTFLDLELERRFVRDLLSSQGFYVVMEQDCLPEFNWYQWSMNQALHCDIYLQLFTERLGTKGIIKSSIVNDEGAQAKASAALWLSYQLKRPFPDQERLYLSVGDEKRYQQSLAKSDDYRSWDAKEAMYERMFRSGALISSVAELEAAIKNDVRLSRWDLMKHRLRRWRRGYFDTNDAGWRHAREDESREDSDSRVAVLKRLRTPLILGAITLATAIGALKPSPISLLLVAGGLLLASGLVFLGTLPSYVWIGKQTVVARGLFGLFTRQQHRSEPFAVIARWEHFDRWFDVSAVTVRFANGHRIFVPFIRNATTLALLAEQPPTARVVRIEKQPDPPEVMRARFDAFIRELQEEDERDAETENVVNVSPQPQVLTGEHR